MQSLCRINGNGSCGAEPQKIYHPGFQPPAQPNVALWPPPKDQQTVLSEDSIFNWLMSQNDAQLEVFLGRIIKERPAAAKAFKQSSSAEEVKVKLMEDDVQGLDPETPGNGSYQSEDSGDGDVMKSRQSFVSDNVAMKARHTMKLASYERPKMPTVQFSTPMFFGLERDGHVMVELMRVGKASAIKESKAAVQWMTKDGSAKAGKKYKASSGTAEFQKGETFVQIRVDLVNNDDWDPTLDFYICLKEEGVQNVELHRYHMKCRVKVIDDDAFPTNKFAEDLHNDRVDDVPTGWLMMEYFKMNFNNSLVHKGSIKWLLTDTLENVIFIFCLIVRMMMINALFMPVIEGDREWSEADSTLLLAGALCFFLPQHLMHVLDYKRVHWKVGGLSRKLLQTNLMRKYMSYTDKAHAETDAGMVILCLFKEIPELVQRAYCGCFFLIKDFGMLGLIVVYQTLGVRLLGLSTGEPKWIAVNCSVIFLYPVVMGTALYCRSAKSQEYGRAVKKAELASTSYTIDALDNFYLLADYGKRGYAIEQFEGKIGAFNAANNRHTAFNLNNEFIPKCLNLTICAAWILFGGTQLVNGDIAMGTFLVNWDVFRRIGDAWASIYGRVLDIDECFINLTLIVRLMNLPTANHAEKAFGETAAKLGLEEVNNLVSYEQLAADDIAADMIPIVATDLEHHFTGGPAFGNVSLRLQQSKLHILAGRRGSGKTTLLKLIGTRIVKPQESSGTLLVPAHLCCLHISKEPLFFMGSLYDNLVYGVTKDAQGKVDKDGDIERVLAICKSLDIRTKTLALIHAEPGAEACHWDEVLSRSDTQLLNIARGLVANPEVLCIHKPSMGLGPNTVPGVFKNLQAFVRERGVLQNVERYFFRRPRTCIYTFNAKGDEIYADCVHEPFVDPSRASTRTC